MRVVSLVPSITETLRSWGVQPIACTRFCEQPDLPSVGGTKNPDVDAIVTLEPDLVIMDEEENRIEDHEMLLRAGLTVHTTAVRDLADVEPTLMTLAAKTGAFPGGPPPRDEQEEGPSPAMGPAPLRSLAKPATLGSLPAATAVFVPIWRRPWMALGAPTYGTSLLVALGVRNVLAHRGPYPQITLDEVAVEGPDLVLAPSEPYPFGERHRRELSKVATVVFVDGKDLFWWGSRTAAALGRLAETLRHAVPKVPGRATGQHQTDGLEEEDRR